MIVTVTPNPSFDRTVAVDELEVGEVHRIRSAQTEAGGKGVNVSRALALGGVENTCIFPANERDAVIFTELLGQHAGLRVDVVDIQGSIRTNTSIIESAGRTTKLNESGPELDTHELLNLIDAVASAGTNAAWIAVCGSLPPGAGSDFTKRIIEHAHGTGTRVAIDASGDPLAQAVAGKCHLIKPNHEELAELVGRELHSLGDVADAATEVQQSGIEIVVVSLGADGALLVSEHGQIHGVAPVDVVRNTVGAGDAFLAGFLSTGDGGAQSLSEALAWGRAAVQSAATSFPPAADADRAAVRLSDTIDRSIQVGHQ